MVVSNSRRRRLPPRAGPPKQGILSEGGTRLDGQDLTGVYQEENHVKHPQNHPTRRTQQKPRTQGGSRFGVLGAEDADATPLFNLEEVWNQLEQVKEMKEGVEFSSLSKAPGESSKGRARKGMVMKSNSKVKTQPRQQQGTRAEKPRGHVTSKLMDGTEKERAHLKDLTNVQQITRHISVDKESTEMPGLPQRDGREHTQAQCFPPDPGNVQLSNMNSEGMDMVPIEFDNPPINPNGAVIDGYREHELHTV